MSAIKSARIASDNCASLVSMCTFALFEFYLSELRSRRSSVLASCTEGQASLHLGIQEVLLKNVVEWPKRMGNSRIRDSTTMEMWVPSAFADFVWLDKILMNIQNWRSHIRWTGPQLLKQLPEINVFAMAMGSAGCITGCGSYLKKKKPSVKVLG